MKKLHLLIPSLVATASMPLIGLVGCGKPTSMTVSLDEWQEVESVPNGGIIYSNYISVPNKCAVSFTSSKECYKWSITPTYFAIAYTDKDGQFIDNLFFKEFELFAGETKLDAPTDYIYDLHGSDGNYIKLTTSGISKVFFNGNINPLNGKFVSLGENTKVKYVLAICGRQITSRV